MMSDIVGYRVKKRKGLDHWSALCEEWILAIQRYVRVVDGDASYWFNELSDVAILSGAAWRCGWVAVTETQTEKGARHRPKHWGRADLYIGSNYHEEYIEAKHRKVSFRSPKEWHELFDEGLVAALRDAKATAGRDQINTCGICFFAPKILIRPNAEEFDREALNDRINELVDAAVEDGAHVAAWCFPHVTRFLARIIHQAA